MASRVVDIIAPTQSDQKSTGYIFDDPEVGGETQKNEDEARDERGREDLNGRRNYIHVPYVTGILHVVHVMYCMLHVFRVQ